MKVDFEILLHECCAKQKQQKISSLGLGSWDQQPKNTRLYNGTTRNQFPRRGYEDLNPHELHTNYESEFSLHFRISNKQRVSFNGWYEYWKYKKDSYSSKASQCVESYFMFFLLAILLLTSIR